VTRRFTKGSRKIVGFIMSANPSKKVLVDEYYVPQTYPAVERRKDCGLTRKSFGAATTSCWKLARLSHHMIRRIASWLAVAVLVWSVPTRLRGWGRDGHAIAAALAEAHLTEGARLGIKALLKDQSLASIASWADEVRPQRDETYNWHFVDIPTSAAFDEQRDCYRPHDNHAGAQTDHHNCVVDRIGMFKQVLMSNSASDTERVEALKFIVHFVADVHQPFHAIGDAKGGNGIRISEFGSSQCGEHPCNLHSAWDTGLIAHTNLSQQEYVQHLEEFISQQHLTAGGEPEDWANESHKYAEAAWLNDGEQVDENYYKSQIKVVDIRLALAGLRLAALLNDAFGQQTAPVRAPTTAWSAIPQARPQETSQSALLVR
jgi:hypothetical protein